MVAVMKNGQSRINTMGQNAQPGGNKQSATLIVQVLLHQAVHLQRYRCSSLGTRTAPLS
jgi:hypothetical protein